MNTYGRVIDDDMVWGIKMIVALSPSYGGHQIGYGTNVRINTNLFKEFYPNGNQSHIIASETNPFKYLN
jgi:hypothetical protein